ncbi:MAG: YchF-related putative GTPase [Candidatus Micrarchaeaceae archaeon]
MLIGIVGAPNKGKSTIFSAMTLNDVGIADYPFTTIEPNMGVAYATKECVDRELKVKCNPRNSICENGVRKIPVNIADVAGLVEGAHVGKGMGNRFLNDIASADALLVVVDASGGTDSAGNRSMQSNPIDDVDMVMSELTEWLCSIIKRHMNSISKRSDGINALSEALTGLKVSKGEIADVVAELNLSETRINWPDGSIREFSGALLRKAKPFMVLANKADVSGSAKNIDALKGRFGESSVIPCSGAIELAMRKAELQKLISYAPGSRKFEVIGAAQSKSQSDALDYMARFLEKSGTGIQEAINSAVFSLLGRISVYPVEDENRYSDHFGNVLPDVMLVGAGSTAYDLASMVHTDIANNMLYAIDAKRKARLAKSYALKDNDVIRIVSAARQQ